MTHKMAVRNLLLTLVALGLEALALPARGSVIFTNLAAFGGTNGAQPYAGLVQDAAGNFYGTTSAGGAYGDGTVFRLSPDGSTLVTLVSFAGANGAAPYAGLLLGADGNLYGTTSAGGTNDAYDGGDGTLFEITTNGAFTLLGEFASTSGAAPQATLTQGSNGNFYGTASAGGPYDPADGGDGTVFEFSTAGGLAPLFLFDGTNGSAPTCALVQGADGNFYGTTSAGGPAGSIHDLDSGLYGALFQITTNGALTNLVSFDGTNGCYPYAGLAIGPDGNFYGTASGGGAGFDGSSLSGDGTVFELTTNGSFTNLVSFMGTNGTQPTARLVLGSDGNFYGTTEFGGANDLGTVFQVTLQGALVTLFSFNGTNGVQPYGGLLLGADGNFYGTTLYGGAGFDGNPWSGPGTIFRLSVPMAPMFQSMTQSSGMISLGWSAVAGQTYQLQYRDGLTGSNWVNFGSAITATNSRLTASEAVGTKPLRFYRAVLLH